MGALLAETASYAVPVNIVFGFIAALMLYGAVRVVTTTNVVHAALWLVVVLAGMAGLFILLQAEFLAVTQVMVYIGAIVVLFLFGVMLTRTPGAEGVESNRKMIPFGIGTAVLLFVVMAYSLIDSFGGDQVRPTAGNPTQEISDAIFSTYLLPFELVSLLLLAALVGAIVLARKE